MAHVWWNIFLAWLMYRYNPGNCLHGFHTCLEPHKKYFDVEGQVCVCLIKSSYYHKILSGKTETKISDNIQHFLEKSNSYKTRHFEPSEMSSNLSLEHFRTMTRSNKATIPSEAVRSLDQNKWDNSWGEVWRGCPAPVNNVISDLLRVFHCLFLCYIIV